MLVSALKLFVFSKGKAINVKFKNIYSRYIGKRSIVQKGLYQKYTRSFWYELLFVRYKNILFVIHLKRLFWLEHKYNYWFSVVRKVYNFCKVRPVFRYSLWNVRTISCVINGREGGSRRLYWVVFQCSWS